MKMTLTPNLKLLFIQVFLTALLVIPLKNASADVVTTVEQIVNSYIEKGDAPLNLIEELNLSPSISNGEKLIKVSVKAQGTSSDSRIILFVNGKKAHVAKLSNRFKNIDLSFNTNEKIEKLSLKAKSAFLGTAIADLVSDEPQVDDLSRTCKY